MLDAKENLFNVNILTRRNIYSNLENYDLCSTQSVFQTCGVDAQPGPLFGPLGSNNPLMNLPTIFDDNMTAVFDEDMVIS